MKSQAKSVVGRRSSVAGKKLGPCVRIDVAFYCPRCDELIRAANIHGKQQTDPLTLRSQRHYRVLCDCCNGAFSFLCGYDGMGNLKQIGTSVEITDPVERGSLISFVNQNRMDIAVAS